MVSWTDSFSFGLLDWCHELLALALSWVFCLTFLAHLGVSNTSPLGFPASNARCVCFNSLAIVASDCSISIDYSTAKIQKSKSLMLMGRPSQCQQLIGPHPVLAWTETHVLEQVWLQQHWETVFVINEPTQGGTPRNKWWNTQILISGNFVDSCHMTLLTHQRINDISALNYEWISGLWKKLNKEPLHTQTPQIFKFQIQKRKPPNSGFLVDWAFLGRKKKSICSLVWR